MGTRTFQSSGCWTVPAGVKKATTEAWGGGGGGGGIPSTAPVCGFNGAGGGGGGGYGKGKVPVTPSSTYHVTVGAGGTVGNTCCVGHPGGTSCFTGNCCKQVGGHGGSGGHRAASGTAPGGTGFGSAACTTHTGHVGCCGNCSHGYGLGGPAGLCSVGCRGHGGHGGQNNDGAGCPIPACPGIGGQVKFTWVCPPTGVATACPTCVKKGKPVKYKVTPCGTGPFSYCWCFGDCSSHSTCKCPSHSFTKKGKFTAKVTITGACCGCGVASAPQVCVSSSGNTPLDLTIVRSRIRPSVGPVMPSRHIRQGG